MEKLNILSDKLKDIYETIFTNPGSSIKFILIFVSMIILLVLLHALSQLLTQYLHDKKFEQQGVLLEILPKETAKIKDTEKLIKNIHAVLLNTKWRKFVYGRPYMSFEIAADQDKIKFYIKVPKDYKNVLVDRIYATYPEIAIQEVEEDYIPEKVWISSKDVVVFLYRLVTYPFKKVSFKVPRQHLSVYGTEMELGYHHVLKIKTQQDKDILGSILSGMKSLEFHEKVVVQILARPLDNSWQLKGRRVLENYERNGKRPTRGNDCANFIRSFLDQLSEDVDGELERIGLNKGGSRTNRKTRMERKEITVASEKLIQSGFETAIRVMAIGHYKKAIKSRVKGITAAFNELDQENRFKRDFIFAKKLFFNRTQNRRMYWIDRSNILTTSELANFFLRLPGDQLLEEFPDIEYLRIKEFAPPKDVETQKNIFAKNFYRGTDTPVGIKDKDLVRHMILQGRTGTGKSEWWKTFGLNHIKQGRGLMLLEPHGKLADEFLELIPEERRKDVIYFDLFDSHVPPFNFCKIFKRPGMSHEDVLEKTTEEVIEIFQRNFKDAWSSKNEYYLNNAIKTVIELQDGNILDIQRLFSDREFRNYAIQQIKDTQLKSFWITEFKENKNGDLTPGTQSTVLSLMHKLGKFLNSKKLLRAVCQDDCIDFKEVLDNDKIVIFRFSKDKMSEDRLSFLGGVALKLLIVAAFARDKNKWNSPFMIAIDEFQNFVTESIETVLDELRKYGVFIVPMHQRLAQVEKKVPGLIDAIYNNVGTMLTFAVGKSDATYFEKIYGPKVDQDDLFKLPSRYGYCKLLVDGQTSETFNVYSMDRPEVSKEEGKKTVFEIKKYNRENRMHYKEIDQMLKERIEGYKNLDENGEDVDSESFVNQIQEEYSIVNEIERAAINDQSIIPEGNSKIEIFDPDDEFNIENLWGDYEDPQNQQNEDENESKEEVEINIDINNIEEYVDESVEIIKKVDLKKEDQVDPEEIKVEVKKNLTLGDFLESETKVKNIVEEVSKKEIAVSLDNEVSVIKKDYNTSPAAPPITKSKQGPLDLKEEIKIEIEESNGNSLWTKHKKIENIIIEQKPLKPEDILNEEGENLWAKAREEGK